MEGSVDQVFLDAINDGQTEIEGEDIIAWAVRRDAKILGQNPLTFAYSSGMNVEGKHPVAWAIENGAELTYSDVLRHPLNIAYYDPVRGASTKNESKDAIMVVLKSLDISKLNVEAKTELLEVMLEFYQMDHKLYKNGSAPRNAGLNDLIKQRYNEVVQSLVPEGEKIYAVESDIPMGRGKEFEIDSTALLQRCDIDLAAKLVAKGRDLESRKFEPFMMHDARESLDAAGKMFNQENDKSYYGVVKSWVSYITGSSSSVKQDTKETHADKVLSSKDLDNGVKR